jgi:hypothetical protein
LINVTGDRLQSLQSLAINDDNPDSKIFEHLILKFLILINAKQRKFALPCICVIKNDGFSFLSICGSITSVFTTTGHN